MIFKEIHMGKKLNLLTFKQHLFDINKQILIERSQLEDAQS